MEKADARKSPVHVRLQADLFDRLRVAARERGRTMHAEIIARIEASFFKGAGDPEAAALQSFLDTAVSENSWFGITDAAEVRRVTATAVKATVIPLLNRLGADNPLADVESQIGERTAAKIIQRALAATTKPASERSDDEKELAEAAIAWGLQGGSKSNA